jgi:hypothetical protein
MTKRNFSWKVNFTVFGREAKLSINDGWVVVFMGLDSVDLFSLTLFWIITIMSHRKIHLDALENRKVAEWGRAVNLIWSYLSGEFFAI